MKRKKIIIIVSLLAVTSLAVFHLKINSSGNPNDSCYYGKERLDDGIRFFYRTPFLMLDSIDV